MEDYEAMARKMESVAKVCNQEIYPVAISRMDEKVLVCDDCDGWGKFKNIPKYSTVLFVQGKLHHMIDYRVGHRIFKPLHPMEDPVFTDLKEYED